MKSQQPTVPTVSFLDINMGFRASNAKTFAERTMWFVAAIVTKPFVYSRNKWAFRRFPGFNAAKTA